MPVVPNHIPVVLAEAVIYESAREVGDLPPNDLGGNPGVVSRWGGNLCLLGTSILWMR
jgi:hypothetical protein